MFTNIVLLKYDKLRFYINEFYFSIMIWCMKQWKCVRVIFRPILLVGLRAFADICWKWQLCRRNALSCATRCNGLPWRLLLDAEEETLSPYLNPLRPKVLGYHSHLHATMTITERHPFTVLPKLLLLQN